MGVGFKTLILAAWKPVFLLMKSKLTKEKYKGAPGSEMELNPVFQDVKLN